MPLGASRLNFLAKLFEEPVTPDEEVTFTWDNWDGTNDGDDVIVHDDTVAGDGNTRHRINMFDDTYGVVSYDVGDDSTNTYWRQITLSNTSVTLGAANTVAENISASHTTAQYAVKINSTKILHGNVGSPGTNIDYIIFTLSGSTVSASSAKTITFSTGTFGQHAGIYFLDTDTLVVEGQTACAVVTYNSGSDTITEEDVFTYSTDGGPAFSNVALYFLRLSSTQWMFAGAAGTPKVAQIYQYTGGTISTVGSSTTIASVGGNLSRHGQNTRVLEDGTTKAIIYGIPDTVNDDIDLIPVKVSGTTISVGSTFTYSTTNATGYPRVDNSVWINDTQMMGIYGIEDNNTIAVVVDYNYSTNTVSVASGATEKKINTDTGYIFQANRSDRVDAERLIVAWTEAGVDTSGDLTLAVLKGNRPTRTAVGLTAVGNAQVDTAVSYFGGGSFLGDGSGDYLDTGQPLIPEYDDWTIECWFRFDNATGEEIIASQYTGGTDGRAVFLYRHGSTAKLRCFINGWSTLESTNVLTNNTWYHGAVSRDGDTLRLFVNGTLESTQTANQNVMQTANFWIGQRAGGNAIDGYIDEFRVSSVARYTSNFTVATEPHVNDSDTLLLTHMNGTDGSTDFFDDNGVRAQVGLAALGSAVNISTAQNKFGGASAHFDASESDQRLYAYDAADGIGTGEFTVETWYRADTFTSVNAIMYMNGRAFYVTSAGRIAYYDGSGFTGTTTMSTNTWYHLVWQRSSDNVIRLFVNGNLETSATKTTNFGGDMLLGCKNANDQDMDGYLDEFRVSNIARYSTTGFTAPTTPFVNDDNTLMLLHMDGTDGSTTFRDDNGTGRSRVGLSAVGNAQVDTVISKFGGASALFDGNDGINAGNPLVPATDNWTVEGWFYPTNISATDYLWAQYAGGQSGRTTGYHTSSGAVGLFINGGPSIGTAAGTMSNNNWYHLAFTRSGSNFAIYVNGVSSATGTGTPSIYQGQPFVIGAQDTVGNNGFIGQIDDVRVSSTVRYTSNFTPPTAPHVNDSNTILLSHMDGTDGSTTFTDDNS